MAQSNEKDYSKFPLVHVPVDGETVSGTTSKIALSKLAFQSKREGNLFFVANNALTKPGGKVGLKSSRKISMLEKRIAGFPIDVIFMFSKAYNSGHYNEVKSNPYSGTDTTPIIRRLSLFYAKSTFPQILTALRSNQDPALSKFKFSIEEINNLYDNPDFKSTPPKFAVDEVKFDQSNEAKVFVNKSKDIRRRDDQTRKAKSATGGAPPVTNYDVLDLAFMARVQQLMKAENEESYLSYESSKGAINFYLGNKSAPTRSTTGLGKAPDGKYARFLKTLQKIINSQSEESKNKHYLDAQQTRTNDVSKLTTKDYTVNLGKGLAKDPNPDSAYSLYMLNISGYTIPLKIHQYQNGGLRSADLYLKDLQSMLQDSEAQKKVESTLDYEKSKQAYYERKVEKSSSTTKESTVTSWKNTVKTTKSTIRILEQALKDLLPALLANGIASINKALQDIQTERSPSASNGQAQNAPAVINNPGAIASNQSTISPPQGNLMGVQAPVNVQPPQPYQPPSLIQPPPQTYQQPSLIPQTYQPPPNQEIFSVASPSPANAPPTPATGGQTFGTPANAPPTPATGGQTFGTPANPSQNIVDFTGM